MLVNSHTGKLSRALKNRLGLLHKSSIVTVQFRTHSFLANGPVLLASNKDGCIRFFSVSLEVHGYLSLRCSLQLGPHARNIHTSFCPLISLEKGEYIEWRPGVALEDGSGDDTLLVKQCGMPTGDNLSSMQREVDCLSSGGPTNVSRTETESSGDGFWSMSPKSTNAEFFGLLYGRFEEVGCSTSGSDILQHELDNTGFSSDLSDGQEEADGYNTVVG